MKYTKPLGFSKSWSYHRTFTQTVISVWNALYLLFTWLLLTSDLSEVVLPREVLHDLAYQSDHLIIYSSCWVYLLTFMTVAVIHVFLWTIWLISVYSQVKGQCLIWLTTYRILYNAWHIKQRLNIFEISKWMNETLFLKYFISPTPFLS